MLSTMSIMRKQNMANAETQGNLVFSFDTIIDGRNEHKDYAYKNRLEHAVFRE